MDKAFQKKLEELAYGRSLYDVWNDFITLSAVTIANSVSFRQEREDIGHSIMKKYGEQGMAGMKELFARTVDALEGNPCQDYLGTMYMEFGFGNQHLGQFFTPYHLAEAMATLSLPDEDRPYLTVGDPCCGSGVMLIAAFHRTLQQKRNPHTQMFCVGQDISFVIAMMCYIQISLLGIAGYVVVGNSLTEPQKGSVLIAPKEAWCTPLYFHGIWQARRLAQYLRKP